MNAHRLDRKAAEVNRQGGSATASYAGPISNIALQRSKSEDAQAGGKNPKDGDQDLPDNTAATRSYPIHCDLLALKRGGVSSGFLSFESESAGIDAGQARGAVWRHGQDIQTPTADRETGGS